MLRYTNNHIIIIINLAIRCILDSLRMGLYMVTFDLDLQGHFGLKWSKLSKNGLVHSITFEGLYLGPPDLVIRSIVNGS